MKRIIKFTILTVILCTLTSHVSAFTFRMENVAGQRMLTSVPTSVPVTVSVSPAVIVTKTVQSLKIPKVTVPVVTLIPTFNNTITPSVTRISREEAQKIREEFKNRIEQIKNERKKRIVERVNQNLANFNERVVVRIGEILDKIERILDKVEEKTKEFKSSGADTSQVEEGIANARAEIAVIRTHLAEQKNKDYTPQVDSVADLRVLRKEMMDEYKQLREDLKELKIQLLQLKDDVLALIEELKSMGLLSPTPKISRVITPITPFITKIVSPVPSGLNFSK